MPAPATAATQDLLEELPELVAYLRAHDYHLSVEDELRLATLSDEVRDRGGEAPDPVALEQLIAPLVCRSPDEQERLPQILARWHRAQSGQQESAADHAVPKEWVGRPRTRLVATVAFAIGFALLAAMMLLLLSRNAPSPDPKGDPAAVDIGGTGPTPDADTGGWGLAGKLPALLPLIGAAVFYRRRRRMRSMARGEAPRNAATRALGIGISRSPLFHPGAIQAALHDLRRHYQIPSADLDIPRTVAVTAQNAGYVRFVLGRRNILPDYLLLADRTSGSDHFGALGAVLAMRFHVEQMPAMRGEYFGDPRRLVVIGRDGRRRHVELARLAAERPDMRLLLLADIADFWDPVRDQWREWVRLLEEFETVAILTPIPRAQWGARERALGARGFLIVPATSEGLSSLAQQIRFEQPGERIGAGAGGTDRLDALLATDPYGWLGDRRPAPAKIEELIAALREALGPAAFYHLCAIAVFPSVNPRLTEQVGVLLAPDDRSPVMTDESYAAIARLPWLRQARIPDWLRKALIEAMAPEEAARARAMWVDLLRRDPASTEQGVAIDIAEARPARAVVRRLLRALRADPEADFVERILLAFLADRKLPDLAVGVPERFDRLGRLPMPDVADGIAALVAAAAAAAWWVWGDAVLTMLIPPLLLLLQLLWPIPVSVLAALIVAGSAGAALIAFYSPALRFRVWHWWATLPLVGTVARFARLERPSSYEANRRLDKLFRAYRSLIRAPLPEAAFARMRSYLHLAGDAGTRPKSMFVISLMLLLTAPMALSLSVQLAAVLSPASVGGAMQALVMAIAFVLMALFFSLSQMAGQATRRTFALRSAWRGAIDSSAVLARGEKPLHILTGRVALEDDQDRDRPNARSFDSQRFLNRVRRAPSDRGSYFLPILFLVAVIMFGVFQYRLGSAAATITSGMPGLPSDVARFGTDYPVAANVIPLALFLVAQAAGFYSGYRYSFLGRDSVRAYGLIDEQSSYQELRVTFEAQVRRADESLTALNHMFRRRYGKIRADPALYLERLSRSERLATAADHPPEPSAPKSMTAPTSVAEAEAAPPGPRIDLAAGTIKGAVFLLSLLPSLAIVLQLVEVPSQLLDLLSILSFSTAVTVVLAILLLRETIYKISRARVAMLSALAVILGAATLVGYVTFANSHLVRVQSDGIAQIHVVPLVPSAELTRMVAPFGGDYSAALRLSADRLELTALMRAESGSSQIILIALLLLAQILLIGGPAVAAWKLAGPATRFAYGAPPA